MSQAQQKFKDYTAPLVSVIVVNHNQRNLLATCLKSLLGQTYKTLEVIVVDNGSQDRSLDLLKGLPIPRLKVVENKENFGFCRANNQALDLCQGTYIALLNNDAIADANWISELVRTLHNNPEFGMAASKILSYESPNVIDKLGHLIYLDGQNRGRGSGEIDQGQYDCFDEVSWPDGCAAFYRRELLEQLQGFDEDFFAYGDDAELGLRARIAGWRCLAVPTAIVWHHLGSTLGRHSKQRLFLIERNRLWLAAKLFPIRLLALNPFYFTIRLLVIAVAWITGHGEIHKASLSLSPLQLVKCLVRANCAAVVGLPSMLKKRHEIRKSSKLSSVEINQMIRRFKISSIDLARKAR